MRPFHGLVRLYLIGPRLRAGAASLINSDPCSMTIEVQEPARAEVANGRPSSVTAIGIIFIAAGLLGLAYHSGELILRDPFHNNAVWILLIRLTAVVGGLFLLAGANWARWFLLIWLAYHVLLSALHTPLKLALHTLLLAVIAYGLFRRPATRYFRTRKGDSAPGRSGSAS